MKTYIPELSEVRMIRRAPGSPAPFMTEDAVYLESTLRAFEAAFGVNAFPGRRFNQIPARELIETFIDAWRGRKPANGAQCEAHARLPSAIRLIDTMSAWLEERGRR